MAEKYSSIIVDDERLARVELSDLLKKHPFIQNVGEAEDISSAVRLIKNEKPDLIFLDIQLREGSGFDLLEKINYSGKVIFVTAYDEYAVRAFETNALDYLLKPVSSDRLNVAVGRLNNHWEKKPAEYRKLNYDDKLFVMFNNHFLFLKLNTIACIEASGDYSLVVTVDGTEGLVNKSMLEWERRLPEKYFCRIHRSTIINIEWVEKIEKYSKNSFLIHSKVSSRKYVVSRRFAQKIRKTYS